ncbi:MAG: DUF899 family protein [Bacteroidetes bacterium]|nr:DUF899 family protein [Bacteroidota bacterium]
MLFGPLLNESDAYQKARLELKQAEIALRDQRELVAQLRRELPIETPVDDYTFLEGPADLSADEPITETRLSDLFGETNKPVVLYQFMFGGAQTKPCPSCTMWTDGFNGIAPHLAETITFAVVAQAGIGEWRAHARSRGWTNLRLLSSAPSSFKSDLLFQNEKGGQMPGVTVIVRDEEGNLLHTYSGSAVFDSGEYRGIDLLSPVWNILDLTPEGRGEWNPALSYDH